MVLILLDSKGAASNLGRFTGEVAGEVGLRDLGRHKLKDIASAEHLFQLDIAGLQTEFAAVKSLGTASSLPIPATSLVDGTVSWLSWRRCCPHRRCGW